MESSEKSDKTVEKSRSSKQSQQTKSILAGVLAVILLVMAVFGGYGWRNNSAEDQNQGYQDQISQLQQKIVKLQKDLSGSSSQTNKNKASTNVADTTKPSAAALENIEASITSGNTAALEGYMAATVRVIIAASEGVGDRTPAQAVSDIKYLNSGTDPWDFSLPAATIDGYQAGDYKSYFPNGALIGKSANNYVVSFTFDSAGKISGVFMVADADLL